MRLEGNSAQYDGGGIFLFESSLALTDVTIEGNEAELGGGMYLDGSDPTLTDVTIEGNEASGYDYANGGGGMYLDTPT